MPHGHAVRVVRPELRTCLRAAHAAVHRCAVSRTADRIRFRHRGIPRVTFRRRPWPRHGGRVPQAHVPRRTTTIRYRENEMTSRVRKRWTATALLIGSLLPAGAVMADGTYHFTVSGSRGATGTGTLVVSDALFNGSTYVYQGLDGSIVSLDVARRDCPERRPPRPSRCPTCPPSCSARPMAACRCSTSPARTARAMRSRSPGTRPPAF